MNNQDMNTYRVTPTGIPPVIANDFAVKPLQPKAESSRTVVLRKSMFLSAQLFQWLDAELVSGSLHTVDLSRLDSFELGTEHALVFSDRLVTTSEIERMFFHRGIQHRVTLLF